MVLRLLTGILAVTFLPLGVTFLVVGLVVENPDRGEPEAFVYLGAALGLVGLVLAAAFYVLWRREAARRQRRRNGLRTNAEVVGVRWKPNVRSGAKIGVELAVSFPGSGGTVSQTLLMMPTDRLAAGEAIEVLYDPAEPANFEPVDPLSHGAHPARR
jgi:hypothetical protein